MDELAERAPFEGLLPIEIGGVRIVAEDLGRLTSVSPVGDASVLSDALEVGHGMAWPKPGRATGKSGARCIWFGLREVLLVGPAPDADLARHAAVVDVSDGWAAVSVEGAPGVDVLARLVPIDLRPAVFKRGHTARTHVGHMPASVTRLGPERLLVLTFRSMAGTMAHELRRALEAVAARG